MSAPEMDYAIQLPPTPPETYPLCIMNLHPGRFYESDSQQIVMLMSDRVIKSQIKDAEILLFNIRNGVGGYTKHTTYSKFRAIPSGSKITFTQI